ncbi:hypothetical protein EPO17_00660 [Patescibacteria group bacterium]|nr:MAG: hypothetical protein EPO17_00660 [Patescibacteria group bacterium]
MIKTGNYVKECALAYPIWSHNTHKISGGNRQGKTIKYCLCNIILSPNFMEILYREHRRNQGRLPDLDCLMILMHLSIYVKLSSNIDKICSLCYAGYMLQKLFKEIGLSENTRSVYSYLLEHGASSARQIADGLGIPRPSVYDQITILKSHDLATERIQENKKLFQIDDIKNLPRLIKEKIALLEKEEKHLEAILPRLLKHSESIAPKIKFYSGVHGVKQVLNEFCWQQNAETAAFWATKEMIAVLGKEYFEDLNRRRIRQNIYTRGLWPDDKKVSLKEYPCFGVSEGFLREIRIAPKGITWDMSYWLYGEDKVAFVSSRQETFGFVIHSKDFYNTMKAQFEAVWSTSKPLKSEPRYTDAFLETV